MRKFLINAIHQLDNTHQGWGALFVNLKMEFVRKHGHGLVTSTNTSSEFFHVLLECIDGKEWDKKEHKGEYEDNFRTLIEIGRKELA
jgi:hypothetical protein